jgi:16S rRNA C1402 (ribose-2'-O) methylase RsmI
MTKMFEKNTGGTVSGAVQLQIAAARGEFTLVVEGKTEDDGVLWTEEQVRSAIEQELKSEKSAKKFPPSWQNKAGGIRRIFIG